MRFWILIGAWIVLLAVGLFFIGTLGLVGETLLMTKIGWALFTSLGVIGVWLSIE